MYPRQRREETWETPLWLKPHSKIPEDSSGLGSCQGDLEAGRFAVLEHADVDADDAGDTQQFVVVVSQDKIDIAPGHVYLLGRSVCRGLAAAHRLQNYQ